MATAAVAGQVGHRFYLCMGRSCMQSGNVENLRIIGDFLERHGIVASVRPMGHLCDGMCQQGPSLILDGTLYNGVNPSRMRVILEEHLQAGILSS